eukprot:scaffold165209_cov46-Attheya_sp.AAC.3
MPDVDNAHELAPHRHRLIGIASTPIAMFTCSILASISAVSWRLHEIVDPSCTGFIFIIVQLDLSRID